MLSQVQDDFVVGLNGTRIKAISMPCEAGKRDIAITKNIQICSF